MSLQTPIGIVNDEETGCVDFVLPIEKLVPTDRGWIGLFASGTHDAKQIGLRILLAPGLRSGFVNGQPDQTAFQHGGVLLMPEGPESDEWLTCVAERWQLAGAELHLKEQVPFTSFVTHGDPTQLRTEEIRFKLFSGCEEDGDYAEWFLQLNVPKGYAAFVEKDSRYRENLIMALSAS